MQEPNHSDVPKDTPRVWALYGTRMGDNQQVKALAAALGWAVDEKHLRYSRAYTVPNFLFGANSFTVVPESRAQLHPPWPDLVIAAGRRSVPPALWIKKQSGNRTKLVQLGRPRAPLHLFDLVVTTAQYGLPEADNVLTLTLPLQASLDRTMPSSSNFLTAISDLPKPWTGVLVGGSTWPFVLDARSGALLASDISQWIGRFGGSALITTSPRTSPDAAKAIAENLNVPHFLHRWTDGAENPYASILQRANQLIVTSDSVSMLSDAYCSGKPTAIWRTRTRQDPVSVICQALGEQAQQNTVIGRLLGFLALKGLFTPPRHVERLVKTMVTSNRVSWFDIENEIKLPSSFRDNEDMERSARRIRDLFNR